MAPIPESIQKFRQALEEIISMSTVEVHNTLVKLNISINQSIENNKWRLIRYHLFLNQPESNMCQNAVDLSSYKDTQSNSFTCCTSTSTTTVTTTPVIINLSRYRGVEGSSQPSIWSEYSNEAPPPTPNNTPYQPILPPCSLDEWSYDGASNPQVSFSKLTDRMAHQKSMTIDTMMWSTLPEYNESSALPRDKANNISDRNFNAMSRMSSSFVDSSNRIPLTLPICNPTSCHQTVTCGDQHNCDPRLPLRNRSLRSQMQIIDMLKGMKLIFSGEPEENVEEFLSKLSEITEWGSLSEAELLLYLPHILDGRADQWYQPIKYQISNWTDFKKRLRDRFGATFQKKLISQIENRVQMPNESILDYLDSLCRIMNWIYPPMQEQQKINRAYENLHPWYLTRIRYSEIRTMKDFFAIGLDLERSMRLVKKYRYSTVIDEPLNNEVNPSDEVLSTMSESLESLEKESPKPKPKCRRKAEKREIDSLYQELQELRGEMQKLCFDKIKHVSWKESVSNQKKELCIKCGLANRLVQDLCRRCHRRQTQCK